MRNLLILFITLNVGLSANEKWWVESIPDEQNAAVEWKKLYKIFNEKSDTFEIIDRELESLKEEHSKYAMKRFRKAMATEEVKLSLRLINKMLKKDSFYIFEDFESLNYIGIGRKIVNLLKAHQFLFRKDKSFYREKAQKINSYLFESPIILDQLVLISQVKSFNSYYGVPYTQESLEYLSKQVNAIEKVKPLVLRFEYEAILLPGLGKALNDKDSFLKEYGDVTGLEEDIKYIRAFDKKEYDRLYQRNAQFLEESQTWINNPYSRDDLIKQKEQLERVRYQPSHLFEPSHATPHFILHFKDYEVYTKILYLKVLWKLKQKQGVIVKKLDDFGLDKIFLISPWSDEPYQIKKIGMKTYIMSGKQKRVLE